MVITVTVPLLGICVFCAVNIVLNLSSGAASGLVALMAAVIAGCVFVGTAAILTGAWFTHKLIRRHSRYTYLDILPDGFVFSLYSGEYINWGEQVIQRKLYFVPFSGVSEISTGGREQPFLLKIRGEIRYYFGESDRLGYHVGEDDRLSFDSPELNERGFERLDKLDINGWFGPARKAERSLLYYLEQFRNVPEKKPFDISEHITRRARKRPQTSNPLLEAPSYDRNWK